MMKKQQLNLVSWFSLVLVAVTCAGCYKPITKTSKYMVQLSPPPPAQKPPPGKSLVCLHRPRASQGYRLYTAVWTSTGTLESTKLVADLGNGHSVAFVCEPGKHYFLNDSVEVWGAVEVQLLPDQVYDLWIDTAGVAIASFKIKPVERQQERAKIPEWIEKQRWVASGPSATSYDQKKREKADLVIAEFISGKRMDKLQHMAADNHR
jgi:hypothetical protein